MRALLLLLLEPPIRGETGTVYKRNCTAINLFNSRVLIHSSSGSSPNSNLSSGPVPAPQAQNGPEVAALVDMISVEDGEREQLLSGAFAAAADRAFVQLVKV